MGYLIEKLIYIFIITGVVCGLIIISSKATNTYDEILTLTQMNARDSINDASNKVIMSLDKKQNSGKVILSNIMKISRTYTILYKLKRSDVYVVYGKLLASINAEEESENKYILRELPEQIEYDMRDYSSDIIILDPEPLINFNNKYYNGEQLYIRSDLYYYSYVIFDKLKQPRILVIEEQ